MDIRITLDLDLRTLDLDLRTLKYYLKYTLSLSGTVIPNTNI